MLRLHAPWLTSLLLVLVVAAAPARGQGLSLPGRVLLSDGTPAARARVDIATAKPRHGSSSFCPSCYPDCRKVTFTDEQGRFQFDGLDPALTFRLLVTKPGRVTLITESLDPLDSLRPAEAPSATPPLSDGLPLFLETTPTNRSAARDIRGRLLDPSGRPIPGALVSSAGEWSGSGCRYGAAETSPVVSDDDGRFSMTVPESLTAVSLEISAEGFAGTLVEKWLPGEAERTVVVPAGATITARVVRDGVPCPGLRLAVVQIDRICGRHFVGDVPAVTDAAGAVRFDHVPAGERFCIYSRTTPPQDLVIETTLFKSSAEGGTRDLGALEAVEPRSLEGRFVLEDGGRIPAGTRLFLGRDPAWDSQNLPIAADGSFAIQGLPPEGYRLGVAIDGYTFDAARLGWQLVEETYVAIPLHDSRGGVTIPLIEGSTPRFRERIGEYAHRRVNEKVPANADGGDRLLLVARDGSSVPAPRTLHGVVVDTGGMPVAHVSVTAMVQGGPTVGSTFVATDATGRFTIESLPELPLEIWASSRGRWSPRTRQWIPPEACDVRLVVDPRMDQAFVDLDPEPDRAVAQHRRQTHARWWGLGLAAITAWNAWSAWTAWRARTRAANGGRGLPVDSRA